MNRRQFLRASSIFSAATLVSFSTWAAGSENEVVLNLDPTRDNPRNSEGAFVTLKSGRILFIYTRFNGGAADESPAQLASIQSDDGGRTWSREPRTVVELADGRLFSWMRTDQGAHFGCYSTDSGKRWLPPARTDLVSPASPASIKRLPGSADLVALYNDHSGRFPFPKGKRSSLVAAVSSDGGKTWPCRKLL